MSTTPESIGARWSPLERARKNARILGKHIESAGCVPTADFAGISKSTVSAWFSENRDAMGKALAFMGLKVVPVDKQCFDPKEVEAYGSHEVGRRPGLGRGQRVTQPTNNAAQAPATRWPTSRGARRLSMASQAAT